MEQAFVLYLVAKEFDIKPQNHALCNLLSLVAGLGDQGSGLDQ